jgi:hypothetical protein
MTEVDVVCDSFAEAFLQATFSMFRHSHNFEREVPPRGRIRSACRRKFDSSLASSSDV